MVNDRKTLKIKGKSFVQFLAGPHIIYWIMPWFMLLLVGATVEQKYIGLYDAVQIYLYNFILWVGPIPLPGGGIALALITISLALKFLFYSPWSWKRSGIIISHLGSLMLLVGGFITILNAHAGFVIIPEGEERAYYQDYNDRKLFIYKNEEEVLNIPFKNLQKDFKIDSEALPFIISVKDVCDNCDIRPLLKKNASRKNLAAEIFITPTNSEINKEENFSGVTYRLLNKEQKKRIGEFIALEDVEQDNPFENFQIKIGRKKTPLPFSIGLQDFQKIDYPGTNKASDYISQLTFNENDVSWPVKIQMNKPYRYKGYSFFQSSFDQRDGVETTVINVVKNQGWLFPYISSFLIFAGLLIHLISRFVRRNKAIKKEQGEMNV